MKEKLLKNILFTVTVIALAAVFILLLKVFNIWGFLLEVENKTFDFRQQIISQYKKANKDIVILAVDDSSYEYIVSTYGAWPAPRDFWAHISDGIEKANPKAIAFDHRKGTICKGSTLFASQFSFCGVQATEDTVKTGCFV